MRSLTHIMTCVISMIHEIQLLFNFVVSLIDIPSFAASGIKIPIFAAFDVLKRRAQSAMLWLSQNTSSVNRANLTQGLQTFMPLTNGSTGTKGNAGRKLVCAAAPCESSAYHQLAKLGLKAAP